MADPWLEIAADVKSRMKGWPGRGGKILSLVAEVAGSSSGDHVEIGALWGASACAAALAKKYNSRIGRVIVIDPFGYENQEPSCGPKHPGWEHQEEIVRENIKQFGLENRVKIIKAKSQPWPANGLFSTALIDGWHFGKTPLLDAQACCFHVGRYILLDDVIPEYPAVMRAFRWLLRQKSWRLKFFDGYTAKFVSCHTAIKPFWRDREYSSRDQRTLDSIKLEAEARRENQPSGVREDGRGDAATGPGGDQGQGGKRRSAQTG